MTLIFGVIVPALMFLVTLPLQSFLFLLKSNIKRKEREEKERGRVDFKKSLGLADSKEKNSKKYDKIKHLSLKAQKLMITAIISLIAFLRSFASLLLGLCILALVILLPIILALVIVVSSVTVIIDSDEFDITVSNTSNTVVDNSSSGTNVVDTTISNTGWVGAIETMAKWYIANVNTYQTTTTGKSTGKRAFFTCDLLDDKKVGDDCSGFAYTCLVYGGYVTGSPTNAPGSSAYISGGTMVSKLESAGFKHSAVTSSTTFQAGDILACCGSTGHHVELVVGINDDGTYQTFGWGSIQDKYPSTASISGDRLTARYTDFYRLSQ